MHNTRKLQEARKDLTAQTLASSPEQAHSKLQEWMSACTAARLVPWLCRKLAATTSWVERVTAWSQSASADASMNAECGRAERQLAHTVPVVRGALNTPLGLLKDYCQGTAAQDAWQGLQLMAPLWQPELAAAVASATGSCGEYGRHLMRLRDGGARNPDAPQWEITGDSVRNSALFTCTGLAYASLGYHAVDVLLSTEPGAGGGASMPDEDRESTARRILDTLTKSELLPTAARAIMRSPAPNRSCVALVGRLLVHGGVEAPAEERGGVGGAGAAGEPPQRAQGPAASVSGSSGSRSGAGAGRRQGRQRGGQPEPQAALGGGAPERLHWGLPALEKELGRGIGNTWSAESSSGWLEQHHWGVGLGGAYGPSPSTHMDGILETVKFALERTPRAQSAAWGLALGVDAAAAEQARVVRGELQANPDDEAVDVMPEALRALVRIASPLATGGSLTALGAASEAELRAQLQRAGLAGSLDRALRLAFSAADAAVTNPAMRSLAEETAAVPSLVQQVLGTPLPVDALCGDGGVAVTLAKRARMLTRRLQQMAQEQESQRHEREGEQEEGVEREGDEDEGQEQEEGQGLELVVRAVQQLRFWRAVQQLLPAASTCLELVQRALSEAPEGSDAPPSPRLGEAATLLGRSVCLLTAQVLRQTMRKRFKADAELYTAAEAAMRTLLAGCRSDTLGVPSAPGAPPILVELATELAAHPELSARVREWLVPPRGDAEPGSGPGQVGIAWEAEAGAGVEAEAGERGCLEPFLRAVLAQRLSGDAAPRTLRSLLHRAAVEEDGAQEGAVDEARGSFRAHALSLLASGLAGAAAQADSRSAQAAVPYSDAGPPGSGAADLVEIQTPPGRHQDPSPEAAAFVAAPLPPPVDVPLAQVALPGLRVCAYPGCLSYGGPSEADLPLKLCARCQCVRYCGTGCQTAHWSEGHKLECRAKGAAAMH
ncbi:hypothetical protein HYH03_000874 [Edaphochlamys debaryana]|uniref:MYND-type domain-containing protein n=1 Tax=Edaphochlamys debaryana TaxID=47281 RepID=A0A836C5N0_9CHLO|nr:hypothetical protein HYH03_000874 [Edaphochlamys debaryana]|eukprot:KAG2501055.1 hypothetical protein HYH03_000874 [Edaphochlamys debaryana]